MKKADQLYLTKCNVALRIVTPGRTSTQITMQNPHPVYKLISMPHQSKRSPTAGGYAIALCGERFIAAIPEVVLKISQKLPLLGVTPSLV
ncbi:MAG: hypothetical protein ACYT04_33990 [Nostoc sp.]